MTATMEREKLPPSVVYEPGKLGCWWRWPIGGGEPFLVEEFSVCPSWEMTGEDGTKYVVFREGGKVNGYVVDPDGARRYCWDLGKGRGHHTPLGRSEHRPEVQQATDVELAAMNRVLRPAALAEPWEVEVSRMASCDHQSRHCWRDRSGNE